MIEFILPSVSIHASALFEAPNNLIEYLSSYSQASHAQALEGIQIKTLLLISSLLSLLIGTIAGLSQRKIKRLLAFSSISHVGFLLLALGIYTQKSVDSLFFYLVQYSITSLNIFLILLAFGSRSEAYKPYLNAKERVDSDSASLHTGEEGTDVNYLLELKGQLYKNPILSISLAICLFSMAGIPPLIGFFSKQFVLYSSIENGNNFLSVVAILVSVISASYYLKLIKITFFDSPRTTAIHSVTVHSMEPFCSAAAVSTKLATVSAGESLGGLLKLISQGEAPVAPFSKRCQAEGHIWITNFHSYCIAIFTFLILFFFLDPSILLNGTQLISLTIFNI